MPDYPTFDDMVAVFYKMAEDQPRVASESERFNQLASWMRALVREAEENYQAGNQYAILKLAAQALWVGWHLGLGDCKLSEEERRYYDAESKAIKPGFGPWKM